MHNIYENGFIVIPDFISQKDLEHIKRFIDSNKIIDVKQYIINSKEIKSKITALLGEDYEFNDYIFLIKKSQFHTCHRDYNGDFFNENQTRPSYTIIIYLEDMNRCLDVIPESHIEKNKYDVYLTDYTQTILCKKRDAILFNANLLHGGSLNENENNMRIQMKISHKDDQEVLHFYNNYNKILNSGNNTPMAFKQIQKHVSCQFPILSTYLKQYDSNKDNSNNNSSFISKFFAELETVTPQQI
jgi:ectoine hydroxylase-related dioxygenase (phytanoyl-CoA dioxygenase family)